MRRLIISLLVVVLLTLTTAGAAFADIDGPPPDSEGCDTSNAARGGAGAPGDPLLKCFPEPDTALDGGTGCDATGHR